FGSMVLSPSTGIILNNDMDNFSSSNITNSFGIPSSGKNRIKPGRRPFSSMSPVIVTDSNGDVKLTLGGSGGLKITTCMAQTLIRTLWLNEDIKKAIDAPRFHHQLLPNVIEYEKLFPGDLLDDLKEKGHQLKFSLDSGIIMGILKDKGILCANSDFRKGGEVDGF
ncbi:glutathione hydrolase 1 proenzyme, partial [Trichonephila clavata]